MSRRVFVGEPTSDAHFPLVLSAAEATRDQKSASAAISPPRRLAYPRAKVRLTGKSHR